MMVKNKNQQMEMMIQALPIQQLTVVKTDLIIRSLMLTLFQ
jgi:hypothetical protein